MSWSKVSRRFAVITVTVVHSSTLGKGYPGCSLDLRLPKGHHGCMKMLSGSAQRSLTKVPPLRTVRTARGMSLRWTASEARIDPAHLSRVERGEKQLSVDALYRLAVVLGLKELAALLAPYLHVPEDARRGGKAS